MDNQEEEVDSDENPEDDTGEFIIEDGTEGPEANEIQENHGTIISKVRKIVRFFRISPLRNDYLQKIIKDDLGTELTLLADVRTRWSSLFLSLERFHKIRVQVKKALVHFDMDNLFPTEDEVTTIKDLIDALSIVEAGSRSLCGREETLASADQVNRL